MADREDDRVTGEHLDEGTAHAWLDGQLAADDAARIETHIATCADCAAVVAEARGFVAASSRILTALDGVPAHVVPRSRARSRIWQVRAAAAVIVVAVGVAAVLRYTSAADFSYDAHLKATVASPAVAPPPPQPVPATSAPARAAHDAMRFPEKKQASAATRLREGGRTGVARETQPSAAPPAAPAATDSNEPVVAGAAASAVQAAQTAQAVPAGAAPQSIQSPGTNVQNAAPRIALAAKAFRAPAAQSAAMVRQQYFDSLATRDAAGMVTPAAHHRCAGKVVSVSAGDSSAGVLAHQRAVRLDAAIHPSSGTFVLTDPVGDTAIDGWWSPVGADSAVVLIVPAGSRAVAGAAGGSPSATPPDVTRVRCPAY